MNLEDPSDFRPYEETPPVRKWSKGDKILFGCIGLMIGGGLTLIAWAYLSYPR